MVDIAHEPGDLADTRRRLRARLADFDIGTAEHGAGGRGSRSARPARARFHPGESGDGRREIGLTPAKRQEPHTPVPRTEYVESLYRCIRDLVLLDVRSGGEETVPLALPLWRSVHRELGTASCRTETGRDLYAAAGELGEVTGWLLYDAGRHDLVRRVNHEALYLSRLAGDSSIELLTRQNMSMHAGHLGDATEALRIARTVLDSRTLSPRLRALFHTREARALALGGEDIAARNTFHKARSLYLDGVRDDDPVWAWWLNDQEMAWHRAVGAMDSGEWSTAVDLFQASLETIPTGEVRRRYNHLASLLNSQLHARAWEDADHTMTRLLSFTTEVRSTRTATTMYQAIRHIPDSVAPHSVRESARQLRTTLVEAGYDPAAPA